MSRYRSQMYLGYTAEELLGGSNKDSNQSFQYQYLKVPLKFLFVSKFQFLHC